MKLTKSITSPDGKISAIIKQIWTKFSSWIMPLIPELSLLCVGPHVISLPRITASSTKKSNISAIIKLIWTKYSSIMMMLLSGFSHLCVPALISINGCLLSHTLPSRLLQQYVCWLFNHWVSFRNSWTLLFVACVDYRDLATLCSAWNRPYWLPMSPFAK